MSKEVKESVYKRYKAPHDEGFTTIPNKLILDKRLSDAAKCVLIYLLHNSPDWKVYQRKMMEDLGHGRDKSKEAVALLEEVGYLRRNQVRVAGKFAHYEYEFHNKPIFSKCLQKDKKTVHNPKKNPSPATEKPAPENPHLPMSNLTSSSKKKIDNVKPANADLTLQFKKKESSKKTLDITKRYALTEEQCQSFELLKRANLNTDEGTLCFYAKTFTLMRINSALIEMHGKKPDNPGAYFRKLVTKKLEEDKANAMLNTEFAQQYKESLNWRELKISKTHVETEMFKISLKMPVNLFIEALTNNMPKIEEI